MIELTSRAAERIREVVSEGKGQGLRFGLTDGGCSGYTYLLDFEKTPDEDDLVFEHEGKYWVLDYKSNALGANDAAYTKRAMEEAMAGHRYDIQGAIYMLALHRLLKSRLGDDYDPARQLGGAVFLFLRGIANTATHGCCLLEPDVELLDGLDQLLGTDA